jgi:hypothetical protein
MPRSKKVRIHADLSAASMRLASLPTPRRDAASLRRGERRDSRRRMTPTAPGKSMPERLPLRRMVPVRSQLFHDPAPIAPILAPPHPPSARTEDVHLAGRGYSPTGTRCLSQAGEYPRLAQEQRPRVRMSRGPAAAPPRLSFRICYLYTLKCGSQNNHENVKLSLCWYLYLCTMKTCR